MNASTSESTAIIRVPRSIEESAWGKPSIGRRQQHSSAGRMNRRLRAVVLIAVTALTDSLLAACDPVPPRPSSIPTVRPPIAATPTPAASHAPTIDFISLTAHDIGVADTTERQVADFPFTMDLASAATGLGHAIGVAPTVTPVAATSCAAATAIYSWPGFSMYAKPDGVTFGGTFIVDVTAAHTSNNIGLVGPYNQSVGDTLAHVQIADPAVASGAVGDGTTQAILDPQEDNFWGVIMTFDAGGTATEMASPGFYLGGYDTCD